MIPARYLAAATAAADQTGVPLDWILGVIGTESSFSSPKTWEPGAGEYSWGPMQILGSTARDRGFRGAFEQLLTPEVGILYGALQLAWLRGRYGADFGQVISAYNRGHADVVGGSGYIATVRQWMASLADEYDIDQGDAAGAALMIGGLALMIAAVYWPKRRQT